ncbi:tyrosine-type recombinase/integrase [Bradyrhizobium cytisi]|uniref:Tyrosine-type recombinase/integrase n=1 Tax=Bradyrhizobium cytisi TaxID=515489 RepID=A0A5S4WTM7_9BRAD|nr:tyrosine-type recombinase/integrase [Bradyrhizobium cytisi]TYL80149.1 tyrosine-type recombinase/integrase [Bradyrhizobium cytisi]
MRGRPKPPDKPLKLKGIHRVKKRQKDGSIKVHLYHRATGLPLDEARLAESYADAEKKMRTRGEDTMVQLIRHFDQSAYFDGLSEEHRKQYVWKLKRIEARWGSCPAATFNDADDALEFRKDALAWHNELGKGSPRSADNLVAALARVLSYAKEKAVIKFNPLDTFARLYKSNRSELTWPEELQQQFIRTARPAMATAMIMVRNTAMRASDVRKFPWTRYDGQRVQIRSTKTGKLLWIPATRELKAHLDALKETKAGALVMLTPTGKAYTKRYFNEHWREDCDKVDDINGKANAASAECVKTSDLNFHDNRGTAATLLAEAGATAPEIAEALCWSVDKAQKVIDLYLARRGVLAANAIKKLEDHRDKSQASRSTTNVNYRTTS